jgi:hypothetical protein
MDPLTVASAVALLVLTKAVEKTGEKLGEKAIEAGNEFWKSLQQKKPKTAGAIVKIAESSDLSQAEVLNLSRASIISDVQQLANQDEEVRRKVEAAAQEWEAQSGGIINSSKLAEKIGVLNQGLILNQQNTINL